MRRTRGKNRYRDQILDLLGEYNDEGVPPKDGISREVLAEEGENLEFEEAIELYYEELTDDLVAMVNDSEVVRFLIIKGRDTESKKSLPTTKSSWKNSTNTLYARNSVI